MNLIARLACALAIPFCAACKEPTDHPDGERAPEPGAEAIEAKAEKRPPEVGDAPGYRSTQAVEVASVRMTPAELVKLDPEDVPERVHLTGVKSGYSGYDLVTPIDIEVYILDSIPGNWLFDGKGKLSVSDRHSSAGRKSVRWDWKEGDIIRIQDLGMLTRSEISGQDGRGIGNGEAFRPAFSIAGLQEEKAEENMAFHFFYKRIHKENKWAEFEPKVIKLRQFANPVNFWFGMTGTAFDKSNRKFLNQEVLAEMPDSIPEPAENELIIQAPTGVEAGTIYLDRLLVAASKVPELKSNRERAGDGLSSLKSGVGVTRGITPDPKHFTDLVPDSLTDEQQAYITGLRNRYFSVETTPHEKGSPQYKSVTDKAKELLGAYCTEQEDGSYRFKNEINYGGIGAVMFKGEFYTYRKFTHHLPEGITHLEHVARRSEEIFKLFLAAPDDEHTKALFKAYIQWERTYIYDPVYVPAPGGKYGYNATNARKIISVIKDKPEFEAERDYISRLPLSGDAKHFGVFYQKRDPYWSSEFPHAGIVFDNMLYEPDDRKLYAMLRNYRDSLNWFYAISTPGRAGMVKPDYTFFHHSALTYWGITNLPWPAAPNYLGGPLDFDPSVHRMWVNHIGRWHNLTQVQGLAAGQRANWYQQTPEPSAPEHPLSGDAKPELTEEEVARAAGDRRIIGTNEFVDYVNRMDWEKIPAAKKHMAGLLGRGLTLYGRPVVEELKNRYPKAVGLEPQTNIHLSANYTGWSSYTHGLTTAYVRGNTNTDGNFREGGTRQYGMLILYGRSVDRPLGVGHGGYSMLEVPGTTMPSLTEAEWNDTSYGFSIPSESGNPNHLPVRRMDGVGAVTFNETEEEYGKAGNHSIIIDESASEKWKQLGVTDFVGRKSYHFFKDRVVSLGSGYQATTDRTMKTVLIQDLVYDDVWNLRDYHRWNPDEPTLNVNGESYQGEGSWEFDLGETNYFINPYGHAWIIPGGQEGVLAFDWKEREATLVSRFNTKGGGFAKDGEYTQQMKGTGVIGRLEQDAGSPSTHHYCVILNSDGKAPAELEAYVKKASGDLGYRVIQQDRDAHAVVFTDEGKAPLLSYVIYGPETELNVPHVSKANRKVNLVMQEDAEGNHIVSISDPEINYDKVNGIENPTDKFNKEDPRNIRTIKVTFKAPVKLLEARSGLPESNPELDAKIEDGNTLTFQTRDGVSDTFVLQFLP